MTIERRFTINIENAFDEVMQIPKAAIEKAIDGEWRVKAQAPTYDSLMDEWVVDDGDGGQLVLSWQQIAFDSSFWRALGKCLGWKTEYHDPGRSMETTKMWLYNAHRFYDLVLHHRSTEPLWQELLS